MIWKKLNLSPLDSMASSFQCGFLSVLLGNPPGWAVDLEGQSEDMEHTTWRILWYKLETAVILIGQLFMHNLQSSNQTCFVTNEREPEIYKLENQFSKKGIESSRCLLFTKPYLCTSCMANQLSQCYKAVLCKGEAMCMWDCITCSYLLVVWFWASYLVTLSLLCQLGMKTK